MDGDEDLPTSVTIPRGVLAELRLVKAEMSKRQGRTMFMPEVMANLIAYWREKNGRAPGGEKR